MKICDVMSKAVVIEKNMLIRQAAEIMSKKGIGSLIVMNKDKLAGVVTERDILDNVKKLGSRVSEIMSKNIICIDCEESLENAASVMAKNRIKRLPVLKNGRLAGIITATDIIANSEKLNEQFFFE